MMPTLPEYLAIIGTRVEAAGRIGDRAEALRLFMLLRDFANEKIKHLEDGNREVV